jgi:hypothetical protein
LISAPFLLPFYMENYTATAKELHLSPTGLAILHGIAIFPLILLVFASFNDRALQALLHSHKLILAGAGLVALFSMLEHPEE